MAALIVLAGIAGVVVAFAIGLWLDAEWATRDSYRPPRDKIGPGVTRRARADQGRRESRREPTCRPRLSKAQAANVVSCWRKRRARRAKGSAQFAGERGLSDRRGPSMRTG